MREPMHRLQLAPSNLVIVLPDSHAHPDLDNDRFAALGSYVAEMVRAFPAKEVCLLNLGDMGDMPSLSSYDKGKKSFEGRRFWKDVQAVVEAQELLFAPMEALYEQASRNKKKAPAFTAVHVLGNHDEHRITKLCELHPELDGVIDISALKYNEYWDVTVPFKDVLILNGVAVSHYFVSGIKGTPIGGENAARSLVLKNHMSCIAGHSHVWDHKELASVDGRKLFGLVGGCYVHPQMIADWNKDTVHFWNNCITVLEDVNDGQYSTLTKIPQETLMRLYAPKNP